MDRKISITADGEIIIRERNGTPVPKRTAKEREGTIGVFEFLSEIHDEEAATAFLEKKRWGDTPCCPSCGTRDVRSVPNKRPMPWHCPDCRRYFSVRTNTVMAHRLLPLRKWLYALYLFHTHRKGISARQLMKELSISKKAAWFLGHRIREAMKFRGPLLAGAVEIDEVYIGGRERNKHFGKRMNGPAPKQPLLGFREREDGTVVAFPIERVDTETLHREMTMNIEPGAMVYTDGNPGYRGHPDYDHEWVNHSQKQYVLGDVDTNGIESFWALFRRGYTGTHHYMSHKHLHRYANEFAHRLNSGPGNDFDIIGETISGMEGRRLTWKDLTGRTYTDIDKLIADIDIYNLPDWLRPADEQAA